jgi:hypothetical protein
MHSRSRAQVPRGLSKDCLGLSKGATTAVAEALKLHEVHNVQHVANRATRNRYPHCADLAFTSTQIVHNDYLEILSANSSYSSVLCDSDA